MCLGREFKNYNQTENNHPYENVLIRGFFPRFSMDIGHVECTGKVPCWATAPVQQL